MKNKKLIIGIVIVIIVFVISILCLIVFSNIKSNEPLNKDYMTKGEYYKLFVEEYNMSSLNYTAEEIKNATDYSIFASIMVEWEYITENQAKKLNKPLTKEIVAQTIVRSMFYDDVYDIEINDIKKCYDKQSLIDSVGMGIFELENGKFNPSSYMTLEEVKNIFAKSNKIVSTPSENSGTFLWNDLKITLNKIEYNFTKKVKISDFINNGWDIQRTEFNNIINGTINNAITNGYNYISIKQKNIKINAYFDMTNINVKVLDSTIIRLEIENLDNDNNSLDFYGIKFGSNREEIEKVFGTKNYELLSGNSIYTYRYFSKTLDNTNIILELQIDINKNQLNKLSIGLY